MPTDEEAKLTRPIIGIENRTPQEVFDIMCDRIRSALTGASAVGETTPFEQSGLYGEYTPVTIGHAPATRAETLLATLKEKNDE